MSALKERYEERIENLRRQLMADHKAAWEEMSEAERESDDAEKTLGELVVIIEAKRKADRLQSFEKLAKIVADASGEVQQVLAEVALKNFQRGEDEAFKKMAQSLDRLGYNLFGRSWIEGQINEVIREQYGSVKGKGNGKG